MKNILYSLLAVILIGNIAFAQLMTDEQHRIMMNSYSNKLNTILSPIATQQGITIDELKKKVVNGQFSLADKLGEITQAADSLKTYGAQFASAKGLTVPNNDDNYKYFYATFAPSTNVSGGKLVESTTTAGVTPTEMWQCALSSFSTTDCGNSVLISDKSDIYKLATASVNKLTLDGGTLGVLMMLNGFGNCLDSKIIELNHLKFSIFFADTAAVSRIERLAGIPLDPTEKSINIDLLGGFRVFLDDFTYRESRGKQSYTFRIQREVETEGILENLVLRKNNRNEYDAFFFRYSLTKADAELLQNSQPIPNFQQKVQVAYFQDTLNAVVRSTIYIIETRDCEYIAIIGASPRLGDFYYFSHYERVCHSVFDTFESFDVTYVIAPGDGFNSPGGGGGGTPIDKDCTSGPTGGGTYLVPISTTPDDGSGNDNYFNPILTKPTVAPCSSLEDPCDELKKMSSDPKNLAALNDLKTKTGMAKESGYAQKQGSDGNYWTPTTIPPDPKNPHRLDVTSIIGGNTTGLYHTHTDFKLEGGSLLFSDEDLLTLRTMAYKGASKNYAGYVVTLTIEDKEDENQGKHFKTFALKIKNYQALLNFFNKDNYINLKTTLELNYNRIGETPTIDNFIKQFLKTIKGLIGENVIGLYVADSNLSDWSEITYDSEQNSLREPIPCN